MYRISASLMQKMLNRGAFIFSSSKKTKSVKCAWLDCLHCNFFFFRLNHDHDHLTAREPQQLAFPGDENREWQK